jgi:hypothetical protein
MQDEASRTAAESVENQAFQKNREEAADGLRKEKNRKLFWMFLAVVLACVFLYQKKSSAVWLPVADSQQMCVLVSDWWGLKVQAYYPVWRKPTGEAAENSEQWCIKYPDNTWQVFYRGNGKAPAYSYPLVTYSTYF